MLYIAPPPPTHTRLCELDNILHIWPCSSYMFMCIYSTGSLYKNITPSFRMILITCNFDREIGTVIAQSMCNEPLDQIGTCLWICWKWLCMVLSSRNCVCVHLHVCVHAWAGACVWKRVCLCICMWCVCSCECLCTCIHVCIIMCVRTYMHVCIIMCVRTYMHVCVLFVCMYINHDNTLYFRSHDIKDNWLCKNC